MHLELRQVHNIAETTLIKIDRVQKSVVRMQIRSANKNDAREIANIIKKHFEEDYMGFASFDEKYIKEKMKKDEFFVAADNGIRGCLRISFVDVDLAEIRALCVDKEFRKKGIAQMLLDIS